MEGLMPFTGTEIEHTVSLALKRLEEEIATDSGRQMQMERLCTGLCQGRRRNYQINKA